MGRLSGSALRLVPLVVLVAFAMDPVSAARAQTAQPPQPPEGAPPSPPPAESPQPSELPPASPSAPAPAVSEPAPAAERTVTGTLREVGTRDPVEGAVVILQGSDKVIVTTGNGRFTLRGVPAGEAKLDIAGPTHDPVTIDVAADQTTVDVFLKAVVAEISVVQRAPVIAKANLANGASVVRADDLNRVTSQTVESALQGKLAGANIQSNSGAPGGGLHIRLRGVSTIIGQAEPLFILDGVVLSNVAIPNGISSVTASERQSNPGKSDQDDQVNRIADLVPSDIESIEVLKGASASALYGSRASNGVVIITTKRGVPGQPKVNITQRFGTYRPSNKLGSRKFATVDEAVATFGEPARAAFKPGETYDHEDLLTSQRDLAHETTGTIVGGSQTSTYYASITQRKDPGIVLGTGYEKQGGRLSLDQKLGDRLKIGFSTNVIRSLSRRGVNNNDNAGVSNYAVLASTPSFWDPRRRADGTFPENPFLPSGTNPLQTAALANSDEEVWRIIGSANLSLTLMNTAPNLLMFFTTVGVDQFQQKNKLFFPPELFFEPKDGFAGTSIDTTSNNRNLNLSSSMVHRFDPGGGWALASTLGLQLESRSLDSVYITSKGAARANVDFGTLVNLAELRTEVADRGVFLQEELLLFERSLSLLGAVRAEQSSTAGDPNKFWFYPKAQAAFSVPTLPAAINLLRVRLAYGEAGNQPRYGQKFTPLTGQMNLGGAPGFAVRGDLGNPNIRPERQREVDLGLDVIAWDDRAVLELSVYQKTISDLLLERVPAPSTGFVREFFNGGQLRNRGLEAMLQLTPVRAGGFEWFTRTIFSMNRSKISNLPIPGFQTGGFGSDLGSFRIEDGQSATQIVGKARRPDGTCCEERKLGDQEPTFRMSFVQGFSFGPFGLSALFDWQKGSDVINLTKLLYDFSGNTADFATAGEKRLAEWEENAGVYIEDASFLKMREIELHYELPEGFISYVSPMKSGRIGLSARNVFTLTSYSGLDPEVSNFGNEPIARNIDVAPYPPSRSFWLTLSAGF